MSRCWTSFPTGRIPPFSAGCDYPEQQAQPLYTLSFPRCGNVLIVGSAGSGKSTLVQTILYTLSIRQTPGTFELVRARLLEPSA